MTLRPSARRLSAGEGSSWARLGRSVIWALCAVLLGCSQAPAAAQRPRTGGVEEHLDALLPLAEPFLSTGGAPLRLGDVVGRGRPALLVLAYSRCSMLCSLVLRATADLVPRLALVPGKDYDLLTISIDPRETPFEAGRTRQVALERAGIAPGSVWPFLVGEETAIRHVAQSVGFSYVWDAASEQFAHPAVIFTISPAGRVSGYFYDLAPDPKAVRAALLGQGTPARGVGAAVLSCFRFDALGRRYGPVVQRCFQAGATLVALALGLGVAGLLRRERRTREASP
jgi:protein SCO1/2